MGEGEFLKTKADLISQVSSPAPNWRLSHLQTCQPPQRLTSRQPPETYKRHLYDQLFPGTRNRPSYAWVTLKSTAPSSPFRLGPSQGRPGLGSRASLVTAGSVNIFWSKNTPRKWIKYFNSFSTSKWEIHYGCQNPTLSLTPGSKIRPKMQDQFPAQIPRRKAGVQVAPSVPVPAHGSVPCQLNTQASQAIPYRRGNQEAQLLEADPSPSPKTWEAPVLSRCLVYP